MTIINSGCLDELKVYCTGEFKHFKYLNIYRELKKGQFVSGLKCV